MAVTVTYHDSVAVVTIDNPPVNAASHAVRQGLVDALAQTEAGHATSVVLACAGRTFVAGADVREFGKPAQDPTLPDVVRALETATKPWIAAIHGAALGGGLEIALGCHYRMASASAKVGLPEVTLGLIPGAGGTVRLPRLVTAETALEMVAGGKPVDAADAKVTGLIDRVSQGDLASDAVAFAREVAGLALPAPLSARAPFAPADAAEWSARTGAIAKRARGQRAPLLAIEAIENALAKPAEVALADERALFTRAKDDPQSLALRHIFFAERSAGKGITDAAPLDLHQIGVVGGGTMGAGIAAACLLAGLSVILIERDDEAAHAGLARVEGILDGSLKRGLIDGPRHAALLARCVTSTHYSALQGADLVIEAVFEDMDVKRAVFRALDAACKPASVLASNTSYLDVSEIAQSVADPLRVIGLHFFSPAHIMKLLELVVPDGAGPVAVATGRAFGRRLGKITVPAGVCDGFIGNRIMSAYRRACDEMLEDGALPDQIDAAMRGFGFPMGIYQMQDLAGLDIAWAMRKRQAATRDPAARYVGIADRLCEAGRFGQKTARGWYRYDGTTAQIDPDVTQIILAASAAKGITRRPFSDTEIISRIVSVMQAEGRAVLDEGIAAKPADIDVVMVNGYAFPRWRGGPMFMESQH